MQHVLHVSWFTDIGRVGGTGASNEEKIMVNNLKCERIMTKSNGVTLMEHLCDCLTLRRSCCVFSKVTK